MDVIYQPISSADAADLVELFAEEPVYRYICDGQAPAREVIDAWIEKSDALFAEHGVGLFVVRRAGTVVGLTGFFEFFDPPVLEFLFVVHPREFRKGYGLAFVRESLARAPAAIDPIRASTDRPNTASLRALARAGFVEVGREIDDGKETVHFELARSPLSAD